MQFFSSKIYNNTSNSNLPVYSILSDIPGFSVDDLGDWKLNHNFRDLFVILNGQQTLPIPGKNADYIYGRPFTGSCLTGYKTYSISRNDSLASDLYDMFGETSIILDILNTQYDWQSVLKCSMSVCYLTTLIHTILESCKPRIWLIGFSRGAALALKLADVFRGSIPIYFIGLIDPVTAFWRDMVFGYLETVNSRCEFKLPLQCTLGFNIIRKIPVLHNPNPNAVLYNVFQRKSLLNGKFLDFCGKPVGCAVDGGLSYTDDASLESQFDTEVNSHFVLRDKYIPKLLQQIKTHYFIVNSRSWE